MDLFSEIDDLSDLFFLDKNSKVDSGVDHEDLQSKYSNLHENYAREIENSKKVEKCLVKCLKFYSKLCKKYEVQQKLIRNLEENIKEKNNSLEEAQKSEERMKGLIHVYRTERALYAGQTSSQLRKDKELLLDICCKLISESVKNSTTRNLSQLLLRKFKKDLDDEKVDMLKEKCIKLKDELYFDGLDISKPDLMNLKNEIEFKSEDKFSSELTKVEIKEPEEYTKNDPLDLSLGKAITEESDCLHNKCSNSISDKENVVEIQSNISNVKSSLPFLEEPATLQPIESPSDVSIGDSEDGEECEIIPSGNHKITDIAHALSKDVTESSDSSLPLPPALISKECAVPEVTKNLESTTQPVEKSGSIFDVSYSCLTASNSKAEGKQQQCMLAEPESFSGISFETEVKSQDCRTDETNSECKTSEGQSILPYEEELFKIFREMSSIRLLSPIRECKNSLIDNKTCAVFVNKDKSGECEKPNSGSKRNLNADTHSSKSKKLRTEEEKGNCNLLDSIMSAMSIQNEEFKANGIPAKEVEVGARTKISCESASFSKRTPTIGGSPKENLVSVSRRHSKKEDNQRTVEKLVMEEIENFVSSPISSKEEADKNVRHCLSVLSNKSEDMVAKCIVTIVLGNIDEDVQIFERPSPPLTKTQHRLIVLISVFRTLDSNFQNISNKILSIISEKLLPDNFFWPDDSVEAAIRFYAALCRAINDPKTLWKFCLQGMTDMRQRCPLLMLTVLKTWPDVLHDASTLKNNTVAITIVNIFLHMPKREGLRNFNQVRSLVGLKQLLLNFYEFKVEETIEDYAKKILDSVFREEPGSEKSIVLLSKCRDQCWTVKNVLPILKSKLVEWAEGKVNDSVANRILSVIKQIFPALKKDSVRAKLKDIGICLSEILISAKKSHASEVSIIEVLLQLKQYPEVRKVIREWIPKEPLNDCLRNEIINASAENILRELKLNRRKEPKPLNVKKKSKKQLNKSKKKRLKGKKVKKNEKRSKAASGGVALSVVSPVT